MSSNRVIIACAGSGKTTRLVNEALEDPDRRIAILTYTNNNAREIRDKFGRLNSGVPKHVDVMTWFGFLLRECARPYQRARYAEKRIESLLFVEKQSALYSKETETSCHYFANGEFIYSDKVAKFAVKCEAESAQSVTSRLQQIYTDVFIDEFQDFAGWDLDVIEMLLQSKIRVTLVGDPRQHIYSTNQSRRNKQYLGFKVINLVQKWQKKGLCSLEQMSKTYRCNGAICDFANALWPEMAAMMPLRNRRPDHTGVFLVAENAVEEYIRRFNPQVLRHDKRAKTFGCEALNFGLAKGRQFDRVLIVPTSRIKEYLRNGDLSCIETGKTRLHVAVTRAFHSVAFVFDGPSDVVPNRWAPSGS
ncbi:MAG: UvrD-helicase domain-containing protein [Planctomycetes bacterium]|nr:UvrD-helicase domain-containing protein [Planctomycetota bacterium]